MQRSTKLGIVQWLYCRFRVYRRGSGGTIGTVPARYSAVVMYCTVQYCAWYQSTSFLVLSIAIIVSEMR